MVASGLPLVHSKGVTRTPRLLVEYENASLPGKTDFLHLSVFADEHGVTRGFRSAVFPAPFAFRDGLLSLLDGRPVSVDHQAIFTRLQISFADLCGLGNVDGLGEWFCEEWHRRCQSGCQRYTAENRIEFHACQLPFRQDRVSLVLSWHKPNRVLTRVLGASSLTRKTPRSSWTNGRKDCVSSPRGCHRGVFSFDPLPCLRSSSGCTCIDEPGPANVSSAIRFSSLIFLIFCSVSACSLSSRSSFTFV